MPSDSQAPLPARPTECPPPQDEAPGDSPLLHLRQRMQLMTTTISTMMMHQPLHQSHLPRVDAHLRHPLCVTTQDETTASVIVEVMR